MTSVDCYTVKVYWTNYIIAGIHANTILFQYNLFIAFDMFCDFKLFLSYLTKISAVTVYDYWTMKFYTSFPMLSYPSIYAFS